MDVAKILAELRQEREQIEEAILSLERLAKGRGRRRGRPPAWMVDVKKRGRPPAKKVKTESGARTAAA
jgi:DNA invertase Pin-like site-specific DNA recombinase